MKFLVCLLAVVFYVDALANKCNKGTDPASEDDLVVKSDCDNAKCSSPAALTNALMDFGDYACGPCEATALANGKCVECNADDQDPCNDFVAQNMEYWCWARAKGGDWAAKKCYNTAMKCYSATTDDADLETVGGCFADKEDMSGIKDAEDCEGKSADEKCNRALEETYQCFEFTYGSDGAKTEAKIDCEDQEAVHCFGPDPANADTVTVDAVTKKGGCGVCPDSTTGCKSCDEALCNSAARFVPLLSILLVLAFWLH